MTAMLARVLQVAAVLFVASLLAACDETDDSSRPPTISAQQGAIDQFCSDLGTLNIGVIQAQALSPTTIAGANQWILTSYDAVRRQALSVPDVNMGQLNDAFNAYTTAVQGALVAVSAGQGMQSLPALAPPLANLQTATTSTGNQVKCPPLATPAAPSGTPAASPASRP
jgi:hypothetical protein